MKNTYCQIALLLALVFAYPETQADTPASPHRETVTVGTQRYRIIPWEELQNFGLANFKKRSEQEALINAIVNIDHANLGGYTNKTLALGISFNDSEAINIWKALLAWLPGNLVVGPEKRVRDPAASLDETALRCLKSVNTDQTYTKIFEQWRNPSTSVEDKKKALLKMASTSSANAATSSCWK